MGVRAGFLQRRMRQPASPAGLCCCRRNDRQSGRIIRLAPTAIAARDEPRYGKAAGYASAIQRIALPVGLPYGVLSGEARLRGAPSFSPRRGKTHYASFIIYIAVNATYRSIYNPIRSASPVNKNWTRQCVKRRTRIVHTSTDAIVGKTLKNDAIETPAAKRSSARSACVRRLGPMVSFFKNPSG